MAKRHEIFPSKYLKEADLAGEPHEVDIDRAPTETLGKGDDAEPKTVLYFRDGTKPLPLNMTNWDSVAEITGCDDTVEWRGHRIELYPSTTLMRGSIVPCIRIRAPQQTDLLQKPKPKVTASANADMDDDIPF
jgi:hypothetical protein